jgi:peptide/nickel transport system permease protein
MEKIKNSFAEFKKYPSAIAGIIVILMLIIGAIYTMITIPYNEAIRLWRAGEEEWYQNPKFAKPAWFNFFSTKKLPDSFTANTTDGSMAKVIKVVDESNSTVSISYSFDYEFDDFPQDMMLYFNSKYDQKQPFVSVSLNTPDGRTIPIGDLGLNKKQTYRFAQDVNLLKALGTKEVMVGLLSANPTAEKPKPLKGRYQLVIDGQMFEKGSDIDAELVLHGLVFGLAGTDHARRDLIIPILWGIPIALAFGLVASVGTSLLTMAIAAIGSWYGGWLDGLIQRITEVNLVIPFLSVLIMIGTFYSRSIWVILSATILLSIFSGAIKSYRANFLQIKESSYIEAARAYGAGSNRIIFKYMIPRMIPLLIPGLVSAVPAFVFLEASLAVLGLGDPTLPTWGKVINDAWTNGALYKGYFYWILEPAVLLMITGLGFAMLGFALDRIFNPRLRGI